MLSTSRLLFGSHVWDKLSTRDVKSINSAHCQVIRSALSKQKWKPEASECSNEMLYTYGFDSAEKMTNFQRLHYLPRFFNSAPIELRALVQANNAYEDSWAAIVMDNLEWIWSLSDVFCNFPAPRADTAFWERFITDHPKKWKKLLKRAMPQVEIQCSQPEADARNSLYECPICMYMSSSERGHTLHLINKHSYRRHSSWFLNRQGFCWPCNTNFHSVSKLASHLQSNGRISKCLVQLSLANPNGCSEAECDALQEIMSSERTANLKEGNNPLYYDRPPQLLCGPCCPIMVGVIDSRPSLINGEGVRTRQLSFGTRITVC